MPVFRKGPLSKREGGEVLGTGEHGVSHDPPSSAKAEDAASAAAERPALPPGAESSRLGAQIHQDEYFTWGEGGARGSVEIL